MPLSLLLALLTTVPPSFDPAPDGRAVLAVEVAGSRRTLPVETTDQALALLADRRFESLWSSVTEWAGADLTALRDRRIANARALVGKGSTKDARTVTASALSPRLRPQLALADALWDAGRRTEAEALLRSARGTPPEKGVRALADWTLLSVRLAQMQRTAGDLDAALATLDAAAAPVTDSRQAVNLLVNRAAWLAEAGRGAEALDALDAAQARSDAPGRSGVFRSDVMIRGSDLHFAWIRACALSRLGRTAEATAAAAPLVGGADPTDKRFVILPTIALREELGRCARDSHALAQAYADDLDSDRADGTVLLELQPGFRHPLFDPAFMARVRSDPVLAPTLARRMRVLPVELLPALNGWHVSEQN